MIPSRRLRLAFSLLLPASCLLAGIGFSGCTKKDPISESQAKLVEIEVEPSSFTLAGKWSAQMLSVKGRFADGSIHDVTASAEFKTRNREIVQVTGEGVVAPLADGAATIQVSVKTGFTSKTALAYATVTDTKDDAVTFLTHVMPIISRLGCNSMECHGSANGKGGFTLSMFGADPAFDYEAIIKAAEGRRVNKVEPLKSLLLAKASGELDHDFEGKLPAGSPDYNLLGAWIAQGAAWNDPQAPELLAVKVAPAARTLKPGESVQLQATAVFSDGSKRDVTRQALFTSNNPKLATVDASGSVKANGTGETAVIASYRRQFAAARILVPEPAPASIPDVPVNNRIDELVQGKLKELGLAPSELCGDAEFLRRIYLDVIGILPTAHEARGFLADTDPQKRAKLIEHLLTRDEFADHWAMKWSDLLRIKSEYPVRIWPKGVQTYYQWVRDSIVRNQPYDQFVRELLTSSGSNFRQGAANYYRAVPNKDAETFGETTALLFMGVRMGCARCHGHPTETWTLDDHLGWAAFFAKIGFKATAEWKEEIVYFNPKGSLRHPQTKEIVQPKFPGGEAVEFGPEEDPRPRVAAWLTSPENPWFAKNISNRVWFWLLGRGIIHEVDDLRSTNPPQNPALLDYLSTELVNNRYDLKHLFRLILNSSTYQLSSRVNASNEKDLTHFSHYYPKRLKAEQLYDAISQVTETSDAFSSQIPEPFTRLPKGFRAVQIADGNIGSAFLELFGRPSRDTAYEGSRNSDPSMWQALYFINSDHLEGKIVNSPRLKNLIQVKSDSEMIEEIYLTALARYPTDEEQRNVLNFIQKKEPGARASALNDLVWAVLNSKEFLFNH